MKQKFEEEKSIKKQLLEEMKNGIYAHCDRLPRETVLAQSLNVSRVQLRDVLAALESEGFITRKHGVGTIINHHVLNIKNRMDIETEFLDIIRSNGYEPSISYLKVFESEADEYISKKLRIALGEKVICIQLLCNADGKAAIYSEDVLDKRLLKKDYLKEDHQVIIFDFLTKFCDVEPYMDLTEIHCIATDEKLAKIFDLPLATPLLKMEEVDYDFKGNPLFYSQQYFVDEYFKHTVLRKRF